MELIYLGLYVLLIGLYFYGLKEAYERGFSYCLVAVVLWPVGVAFGLTRAFRGTPYEDTEG